MRSGNLIFEALAFIDDYEASPSMQGMGKSNKIRDIYLKNAVVSLVSIKSHNPNTDVALVTNIHLDDVWKKHFLDNGIYVWFCEYENFSMPREIVYSLSYYKLCAFDYVLKEYSYERMCFVDCDTYGVGSFDKIWTEVDSAFLMIPNESSYDAPVRKEIIDLYRQITGENDKLISHICSSFIAATYCQIEEIMRRCQSVYDKIINLKGIAPKGGDEIIWSLALADYQGKIYSPKGYVLLSNIGATEYWVDKSDYEEPNIIIWHLPAEKRYSLVWAYNQYKKSGILPTVSEMAKACRLRHVKCRYTVKSIKAILSDNTALSRNIKKIRGKLRD